MRSSGQKEHHACSLTQLRASSGKPPSFHVVVAVLQLVPLVPLLLLLVPPLPQPLLLLPPPPPQSLLLLPPSPPLLLAYVSIAPQDTRRVQTAVRRPQPAQPQAGWPPGEKVAGLPGHALTGS